MRVTTDMARKVVVTGCCGRLGRGIANEIAREGFSVIGIDRNERPAGLATEVTHLQTDLMHETSALTDALAGIDSVIHLAACPDDADFERVLIPTNVALVVALLEACQRARVSRVVVASSGKVHAGHAGPLPIRLSDSPAVVCNYGATKLFAEGAAQAFAVKTGTPTVAIRFAWCPRTPADVVAMRAATGPGMGSNEFVSPEDAGRCVVAALRCDASSFVAATMPPTSAPFALLFCQSKPLHTGGARFDMSPAKELIGFEPMDTFDDDKHSALCAADYSENTDVYKRSWP